MFLIINVRKTKRIAYNLGEDIKGIVGTKIDPKNFDSFEKQVTWSF